MACNQQSKNKREKKTLGKRTSVKVSTTIYSKTPPYLEILKFERINILYVGVNLEGGKGTGHPLQLFFQRPNMIGIHVRVTQCMNEFAGLETTDLGHHASQQGIRSNIEGYTKTHITRALIHLTRQFAVRHIELTKHMARRQSHFPQICRIPRTDNDAPVVRVGFDRFNGLSQLIIPLSLIVCVHVGVFGSKMTPLKPVNRTLKAKEGKTIEANEANMERNGSMNREKKIKKTKEGATP